MKKNKYLWAFAAVVLCGLIVIWFSASIQGNTKTYEFQPHITTPEYRTDAARAIDAYERLMERYMDLTERNLFNVSRDIRDVVKRLDSIDSKLTELSERITRIEKALSIKQPNQIIVEKVTPETSDIQSKKKSPPSTGD
jgi:hypothetical protein